MTITEQGQPIHLMSQNKCICFWHQQLAYVSNARIIKASKLVDNINLKQNDKEYNSVEVLIDFDESDTSDCLDQVSDCSNQEESSAQLSAEIAITRAALYQTKVEDFDALNKLCRLCVESKST